MTKGRDGTMGHGAIVAKRQSAFYYQKDGYGVGTYLGICENHIDQSLANDSTTLLNPDYRDKYRTSPDVTFAVN
jgi:hypothetical protein